MVAKMEESKFKRMRQSLKVLGFLLSIAVLISVALITRKADITSAVGIALIGLYAALVAGNVSQKAVLKDAENNDAG